MIESAEEFMRLCRSSVPAEYHRAAHDEAAAVVWHDVIDRFPELRRWVAHSKTVPLPVLERLRHDSDPLVRSTVRAKGSWRRAHSDDFTRSGEPDDQGVTDASAQTAALDGGESNSLAASVRSYLDDEEVELLPGDPAEHGRNTWRYSYAPGDVDRIDVGHALHEVAAGLRARFAGMAGPATFYAWVDELSGHLKCSLASADEQSLPFGGRYQPTHDVDPVIAGLFYSDHPGLITWDELDDNDADHDTPDEQATFPVWTQRIL